MRLTRDTKVRSKRAYNGRSNGLINALESENAIPQILVLSVLIEERPFNSQELLTRVFT